MSGPSEQPAASDLLELTLSLARAAGDEVLRHLHGRAGRLELAATATTKTSRTDLVTAADQASERLILERLAVARPEDGVLAEESGTKPGSSGLRWVVDPLDGTTNFLYGFPAFAVSIACEDERGALVGVVHDPLRGETFRALRGGGAWLGDERLEVGPGPELVEALIGTGFAYGAERRALQARLLTTVLPAVRDVRRAGAAALDLCFVAAGRLDGFYEAGLQPWDSAAAALVVREAGGSVEWLDGIVPGAATIVAGAPRLCAELARLLLAAADRDR